MNQYDIRDILRHKILVLDGAMGTMIQRYGLEEKDFRTPALQGHVGQLKGCNDLLSLSRADIIGEIHELYLRAGADLIETNTFSSNAVALADYGLQEMAYELNVASCRIAREVADRFTAKTPEKPRFVVGSIGPTSKTASMSADVNDPGARAVSFEELDKAYREQVRGMMDAGADLLMIETAFDTLNVKAAVFAAEAVFEEKGRQLPLMISGTITDASGRTLSGQTVEAFLISVSHAPLLSIGLNCALGASEMEHHIQTLREHSDLFISAHPNAGLPNAFGGYDQSSEMFAAEIKPYLEKGLVNIIGGCCGTTPDYIAQVAALVDSFNSKR